MSASGSTGRPDDSAAALAQGQTAQIRYFLLGLAALAATAVAWPWLGRGLARLQFMPHVFCYLGNPTLITTHLVSDLLIGTSYVVISCTLIYLVRASQGGIPFHWMFLAFGTFIIACGGTHFMEAITLWYPIYWTSAYVKVVTAVASVATAIALPLALPRILKNVDALRLSETRELQLINANEELSSANEKLKELDRLRRRFVAQAAADFGEWEWDIPGGRVHWSTEVERMHGLEPGSFQGTLEDWINTVHPDDREHAVAAATAAVETRTEYDIEYRTLRPDGSFYWTAARAATEYSPTGEPLRMVGMCIDITKRKQTEEALRKSEKLAAAGRLAATIAHEINNPLEAVTNLLYLARSDASNNRHELLEMADHELQRVGHITRQTLGFYRETSTPVNLDLRDVLKSVVDIFQAKLKSKGVTAVIEANGPTHLPGVQGELRQVFSNLLNNALDASPAGSTITIRIRSHANSVRVLISDCGGGISRQLSQQIFEPFFTTKKDVGTGLGLWITRQIISSHGGTIRFRSSVRPGKSGTVFVVCLPANGAARQTAA